MDEPHLLVVCGRPILHSKSPEIFASLFNDSGAKGYYTRLAVNSAAEAIRLARELGLEGMNVTAPFKSDVLNFAENISSESQEIGALNTVSLKNRKISAYNTDCTGSIDALKKNGISLKGKKVLVIGAGNSGRAVVHGLATYNSDVTIVNRDKSRSVNTAEQYGIKFGDYGQINELMKSNEIIVSTLPRDASTHWILPGANHILLDAIYHNPGLKDMAEKSGCFYIPGEEWLIEQARNSFEILTGTKAPEINIPDIESRPAKIRRIALIGFMGSGKTTIGGLLSGFMGMPFYDMDIMIESKEGKSISEIFTVDGEKYFRKSESNSLKVMVEKKEGVIACGGGIIELADNISLLESLDLVIWLYSDIETCISRIKSSDEENKRPLLKDDKTNNMVELMDRRKKKYFKAADMIIISEKEADICAERIAEEINYYNGSK